MSTYNYRRLSLELRGKIGVALNRPTPISQYELADLLGTSRSSISHIETGRGRTINGLRQKIRDLSVLFGVIGKTSRSGLSQSIDDQIESLVLSDDDKLSLRWYFRGDGEQQEQHVSDTPRPDMAPVVSTLSTNLHMIRELVDVTRVTIELLKRMVGNGDGSESRSNS
jgi:transcriptional regulator with XRE-family HTH domain